MDKLTLIIILSLIVAAPAGYYASAIDFTITRQAGDTSEALLIEKSDGTNQFWVDKDGYVYANGTKIRINSITCGAGEGFTVFDNATGLFTCTALGGASGELDNIGSGDVALAVEGSTPFEIKRIKAGAGITLANYTNIILINSTATVPTMEMLGNWTGSGCATGEIPKVSGVTWSCAPDNSGGGGSSGLVHYPYDYFIYTNATGYYAYNNTNALISNNADLDTVWTAVKAHTDYANNDQVFIQFGVGQFITDTGIDINRNNVTVAGLGTATWIVADSSTAVDVEIITIGASPTSTTYNIADASRNANVLTTDTASDAGNFASGDYLIIKSDENFGDEPNESLMAEQHKVKAGYSGNGTIQLFDNLYDDYTTIGGASPTVQVSNTLIHNVMIRDLGLDDLRPQPTSGTAPRASLYAKFVNNLNIDNVIVLNGIWTGIRFEGSMNVNVSECQIQDIRSIMDGTNNHIHYGVAISGLNNGVIIQGCNFENTRHAVTTVAGQRSTESSGLNRSIVVDGNQAFSNTSSCYDLHDGAEEAIISNNACEGRSNYVTDNQSTQESLGISARSPAVITGNTITNVDGQGISLFQTFEQGVPARPPSESIIANNKITDNGGIGIRLQNVTNALVIGNIIERSGQDAINSISTNLNIDTNYISTTLPMWATFKDNIILDVQGTGDGIEVDHPANIIGNFIERGNTGIRMINASTSTDGAHNSVIKDNEIRYSEDDGLRIGGANNLFIDGNVFYRTTDQSMVATAYAGWDFSNSTIINNRFVDAGYPADNDVFIYIEDMVGSVIANNFFQNSSNVNCAIRLAVSAEDNVIMNNVFSDVACKITIDVPGNNTVTNNYSLD